MNTISTTGRRRRLRFALYVAKDGWRWRLIATNGKIVADSGESYKTRTGALKTVRSIMAGASDARVLIEGVEL